MHDGDPVEPVSLALGPGGRTVLAVSDWGAALSTYGRRRPSLLLLRGKAPYLHDVRYASLHDLLSDPTSRTSGAGKLSPPEVADLVAYLGSL